MAISMKSFTGVVHNVLVDKVLCIMIFSLSLRLYADIQNIDFMMSTGSDGGQGV